MNPAQTGGDGTFIVVMIVVAVAMLGLGIWWVTLTNKRRPR